MDIHDLREYLPDINQDDISFDPHFYKRAKRRPINEGDDKKFFIPNQQIRKNRIRKREE